MRRGPKPTVPDAELLTAIRADRARVRVLCLVRREHGLLLPHRRP